MGGIPEPIPFSENGIANLMSVSKLIDQGFRIYMDSAVEHVMYVERENGNTRTFNRSKNGLFYHDPTDPSMVFM